MLIDDWTTILQLIAIGFTCGLVFGDFLDRRDPLSWKYYEQDNHDVSSNQREP